MKNKRNNLSNFLACLLTIALLLALASLIWASDRSMGLSDEGLYLLAARFPEEIAQNVSAVYSYTGFIFRLTSYDVAGFRLIGIFLIVLSGVILWVGYCKFVFAYIKDIGEIYNFRWLSLVFIMLGAVLHYQWSLATPSYYTLTAVTVTSATGFVLFAFGCHIANDQPMRGYAALVLSGLSIGAAFFIKFPAGASLFVVTAILIACWKPASFQHRFASVLMLTIGFVMWMLLHFIFVQNAATTIAMFRAGWNLYQTLGAHSPTDKLFAYPLNVLVFGYSALAIYWPCYMLLIGFLIVRKANRRGFEQVFPSLKVPVLIVFSTAALLSFKAGIFINGPDRYLPGSYGTISFYLAFYLAWIFLIMASHMLASRMSPPPIGSTALLNFESIAILLFLFLAPFTASVGTSNPLYNVISFYSPPWFGILLFLLTTLALRLKFGSNAFALTLLLIGCFAASNTIQGSIFAPSLLQPITADLLDQTVPTDVGLPPQKIKLDPELHRVIEELRTLATAGGFRRGDDIIAVSYMPGLVFALGARSPGHPAFLLWSDKYLNYSKVALQFSTSARRKKALLLVNKDLTTGALIDLLGSGGLDYPGGYIKLGSVLGLSNEYTLYKPID